ncbi:MAG: tripartite tricarboxylate transporter substrate binding protein [Pseudolabrys sp.]|nr:tripartite tricarboxylate transporter substrate binding protein [Pseudolabrys sp.]MBV9954608.1 tripartite tricarboxylate transporter substrate binding protein [Pseudolabrys sp.]
MTKRIWSLVAALVLAAALTAPAQAKWPERPIKLILPFGPGGVADVTARILAEKLGDKLGQRVVVENQPGPGGIAAAKAVTGAPPDGYTLGLVTNGTAISVATFKSLPFDPVKDFELISTIGEFDLVFVTGAKSKYKTLEDFLKDARANPGKLNIGTIIVGSTQNLGAELFRLTADLKVTIVPFKNSPDLVVSTIREDVQLLVDFPPAVRGQVDSGDLKILASSSPKRSPLNKDTPTVAESGVPGYEVTSWNAIGAPKGTPKEALDTVRNAVKEILATDEVKQAFAKVGVEAKSSSSEELMKRLQDDIKKWNVVIDKAGIERK